MVKLTAQGSGSAPAHPPDVKFINLERCQCSCGIISAGEKWDLSTSNWDLFPIKIFIGMKKTEGNLKAECGGTKNALFLYYFIIYAFKKGWNSFCLESGSGLG